MRRALLFLAGSSLLAPSHAHAQDLVAVTPGGTWGLDPATGQTSFLAQQEELQGPRTAITRGRSSPGSTP